MSENKKDIKISFKVNEEENNQIEKILSKDSDLTKSSLMRKAIEGFIERFNLFGKDLSISSEEHNLFEDIGLIKGNLKTLQDTKDISLTHKLCEEILDLVNSLENHLKILYGGVKPNQESKIDFDIMIIDDKRKAINYITLHFEVLEENYLVKGATSVEKAREILKKHKPKVILLDLMFGNNDSGIDFCKELKADGNLKNVPVFFHSAKSLSKSQIQQLITETRAEGFISKGGDLDIILKYLK